MVILNHDDQSNFEKSNKYCFFFKYDLMFLGTVILNRD